MGDIVQTEDQQSVKGDIKGAEAGIGRPGGEGGFKMNRQGQQFCLTGEWIAAGLRCGIHDNNIGI